jgi:hypothetical protein
VRSVAVSLVGWALNTLRRSLGATPPSQMHSRRCRGN